MPRTRWFDRNTKDHYGGASYVPTPESGQEPMIYRHKWDCSGCGETIQIPDKPYSQVDGEVFCSQFCERGVFGMRFSQVEVSDLEGLLEEILA